MGLFSYLRGKLEQKQAEIDRAAMQADDWDIMTVCYRIQSTKNTTQYMGYSRSLDSRVKQMPRDDVKQLLNELWRERNAAAIQAIYRTLENLDLVYKNEDGKICRKNDYY